METRFRDAGDRFPQSDPGFRGKSFDRYKSAIDITIKKFYDRIVSRHISQNIKYPVTLKESFRSHNPIQK